MKPRLPFVLAVPQEFECPVDMAEHCAKIFDGEYDVPGFEMHEPRVLDIGANVGAYAVWAAQRWPGARLACYEPNPLASRFLCRNVHPDGRCSSHWVHHVEAAVRHTGGTDTLYYGRNNLGEASFHDLGAQRTESVEVRAIAARTLPPCDILKIDTEGCELEILTGYLGAEGKPMLIVLEFHRERDRLAIDRLLVESYALLRARIDRHDRGILAYVPRGLIE